MTSNSISSANSQRSQLYCWAELTKRGTFLYPANGCKPWCTAFTLLSSSLLSPKDFKLTTTLHVTRYWRSGSREKLSHARVRELAFGGPRRRGLPLPATWRERVRATTDCPTESPRASLRNSTRSFPRAQDRITDGRTETETGGLNCRWDSFLPPPSSSRCRSRRRTDGRRRGRRERSKVLSLFLSIYLVRALLVFWALCTSSIPHLLNLSEADDGYDGTLSVIRWRHIQRRNPGRRGKSSGWRWRGWTRDSRVDSLPSCPCSFQISAIPFTPMAGQGNSE